jgi:hypothetical protein
MFTLLEANLVKSDEGFSVKITGRVGIINTRDKDIVCEFGISYEAYF